MKLYVMTDMEGVCGVINHDDWVIPSGWYYEEGKKLLTLEVNAAVDGFFAAGATEVVIVDGHGHGGINPILLDSRTHYSRGWYGPYPFGLNPSFAAVAHIGQHAKSGTPYAHLAHTGSFNVRVFKINGLPVGEFGQMAMIGSTLGIPLIFASGDEALTKEAADLVPGIETVAVKTGVNPDQGNDASAEAYARHNLGAVHLHPEQARSLIRKGAEAALKRFLAARHDFHQVEIRPPFSRQVEYRSSGDTPGYVTFHEHPDDLVALLNIR